jgi:hypothetical protein
MEVAAENAENAENAERVDPWACHGPRQTVPPPHRAAAAPSWPAFRPFRFPAFPLSGLSAFRLFRFPAFPRPRAYRLCFPSAISSMTFRLNAGMSSGFRLVTMPSSTTTSSSTQSAPALRRSVLMDE